MDELDKTIYSKDIKLAIFDDMLEITSAGTLPPSIDISELSGGQSEIRNRVLAPIFKKLGLIEQWGTGFRKIQEALKEYPDIELRFNEPGMSFQMQFVKKDYQPEREQVPSKYPATTQQLPRKFPLSSQQVKDLLRFCEKSRNRREIQEYLNLKDREYFRSAILRPLLDEGILEMLYPNTPNSPKQKYMTTKEGKELLKSLEE
ncbi:MAG: ATP-binding protein [Promethearchaeota archaeon]